MKNVAEEYRFIVNYLVSGFPTEVSEFPKDFPDQLREEIVRNSIQDSSVWMSARYYRMGVDVFSLAQSFEDYRNKTGENLLDLNLQALKKELPDAYHSIAGWLHGITDGIFNAGYSGLPDFENLTTLKDYAAQVSKLSDVHRHHI